MKINKILSFLCVLMFSCCLVVFSACKDSEDADFNIENATGIITKLEAEDDVFFNAITTKYNGDANSEKLAVFISTIEELNTSIKTVISNFSTYKSSLASSEYANTFTYGEDYFKYETEVKLINISYSKGEYISVVTKDVDSVCNIEIKMIEASHYAVRCYIKEPENELGEELLYYFNGSAGRIRSKSCVETKSKSIFEYEDFTSFAIDEGTGYYFFM